MAAGIPLAESPYGSVRNENERTEYEYDKHQ